MAAFSFEEEMPSFVGLEIIVWQIGAELDEGGSAPGGHGVWMGWLWTI